MRLRLFEFEDFPWFPDILRRSMLDHLRYLLTWSGYYCPAAAIIAEGMRHTHDTNLLDLCSGGGGAIEQVQKALSDYVGKEVPVVLTDLYPNTQAYRLIKSRTKGAIRHHPDPVDATQVESGLRGFRTMFSAFHHFSPEMARRILQDAVEARSGIAIFDSGDKSVWIILSVLLIQPFIFLVMTPFYRPFRLSRLVFTYLLPLIPLCTIWDGVVSILRLYSPADIAALTASIAGDGYRWRSGKVANRYGMKITYLLGYPAE